MEPNQPDLLTDLVTESNTNRRKDLLPWWIKIFMWIFLVLGSIATLGFIIGLLGYPFEMSLYGIGVNDPLSISGIVLITIFIIKGITAYGLVKEKDWAIITGIIDAIIGIVTCLVMAAYPLIFPDSGITSRFRFEILILIPYLIKLLKIRPEWDRLRIQQY
jgi:hypothetical protein